jgi:hypothetical protein
MRTVDLTTVSVAQTPYGRWAALNEPLGLDALGVNAIDADPGEQANRLLAFLARTVRGSPEDGGDASHDRQGTDTAA